MTGQIRISSFKVSAFNFWLSCCGCWLLACAPLKAQISPEKFTAGHMDKGKWQKSEQTLRKALAKDTLNAEARYLLALYFYSPANPAPNLDSAFGYITSASSDFRATPMKERERLKHVPLDSVLIARLAGKIDSAAFNKAKGLNTEASYQRFINLHVSAVLRSTAIELRDEVAFLEAQKTNTWFGYQNFITRHPDSHRKMEAQSRFDKLLFEDKTRSQKLSSYLQFIQQFPGSPYRRQAEKNIFEISTASGSPESFQWFIQNYPHSRWERVAKDIAYTLISGDQDSMFDISWKTDSLRHVELLNTSYWVPVFKSGLYGFIDQQGTDVMPPRFEHISDDYRCGDVKDPLLLTSQGLIARNGIVIWKAPILEKKDIGQGFVLVSTDSGKQVLHESGFRVGANAQNAKGLANRFIAVERNKKWAVYSLAGRLSIT